MSKKPSFFTLMKPAHLKTVRALGYTLTLGDQVAWWGMVSILMARLTVEERSCLTFMALKSLDDENGYMTAEAALDRGAGIPLPPLVNFMDEAAFWADMAAPEEREAYCLSTFQAMPPARQAAFLDYIGDLGRAAA